MSETRHNKASSPMLWLYLLLMVVVGGLIIGAIIKIQWVDGAEWRLRAENKVETTRVDAAQRGNIYSSDGKLLATTVPVCDLYLDLGRWPKRDKHGNIMHDRKDRVIFEGPILDSLFYASLDSVCIVLHRAIPERSVASFRDRLLAARRAEKPNRCLLVARGIPYSTWMQISHFKGWDRGVLKTVVYNEGERSVLRQERAHVYGNMGKNVIGFRNSQRSNTYTGLEGYYDTLLRGQDGLYRYRRLTRGTWLRDNKTGDGYSYDENLTLDSVSKQQRIDGVDIVSTIDTRYQDIAETALREQLTKHGATSGCAVLMEVATGYVLACSSLVLDTTSHTYIESIDNNVACSDLYEPGSTFKTVFLTALFDDPKVKIDTAFRVRTGRKVFSLHSGEIRDDEDKPDSVSIKRALAISSNVGMCELAWTYYRNRRVELREKLQQLVPYEPLMLDLRTNEPRGTINEINSDRGFLNLCYGYNGNVTVLQMLTFYNALAGNGRMVKPLFCRAVSRNGRFRNVRPVVLNEHICSERTAKLMHELLTDVVLHGTGNNIRNSNYGIAGKTGTSRVYNTHAKQYYDDLFYASFAGFFPADNPKYSCIVVVKNVHSHGRQAAAPVFKCIADCVMSIDKDINHIHFDQPGEVTAKRPAVAQLPAIRPGRMPDCKGLTLRESVELLEQQGLRVRFDGYGRVQDQSPAPGTTVRTNQNVVIHLK